nr:unnamed protein product [Digitaria exilis]
MRRKKVMIMHGLLKAESVTLTPIPTLSPSEGNMTFIDGATWCMAL